MSVQIERRYRIQVPIDVENVIKALVSKIPPEHLIGLGNIIVLDEVTHKRNQRSGGLYWQKNGEQPARIEIGINSTYGRMPRIVFYCPFVAKFMLANVLYHEIGHHYQHFTHGISKNRQENFADKYRRQMLKKAFFWWGLFFKPLSPLIHLLNRISNKGKN